MRFVLVILGCLFSSYLYAAKDVNKCVDASGKKNYQARPCPDGVKTSKINIKTGSSTDINEEQKQLDLREQKEKNKLDEEKKAKQEQLEQQAAVNKDAIKESEKTQEVIKNNSKQYSPNAIPPYQPDQLSELVKKYQIRLVDIERMRRTAAEKALSSTECDRVESSELSPKSTEVLLSFLVNCSNGKSFFYTELDFLKKQ